jgi:hypothetical protein
MPQRRLLTVTLAGLLAMVGIPGIGPPTAVQAQSEEDCEEVDCVADEQSWEDAEGEDSESWDDEAAAEPESDAEFADESDDEAEDPAFASDDAAAERDRQGAAVGAGDGQTQASRAVPVADPASNPQVIKPSAGQVRPASPPPAAPATDMDPLTLERFACCVNETFTAVLNDMDVEFVLVEAGPLLLFRSISPILFPQQMYQLRHPRVGEVGVYLIPVSQERGGFLYRAVVN